MSTKNFVFPILSACLLMGLLMPFAVGCKTAKTPNPGVEQPASIITNADEIDLAVGENYQLMVADSELFSDLTFVSSAPAVAAIAAGGLVTAISAGSASIRVSAAGLEKNVPVFVSDTAAYALILSETRMTTAKQSQVGLSAAITRNGIATADKVQWSFDGGEHALSELADIEEQGANVLKITVKQTGRLIVKASGMGCSATCWIEIVESEDKDGYPSDQLPTIDEGLQNPLTNYAAREYFTLWSVDDGALRYDDGVSVTMSSGTSIITVSDALLSQAAAGGYDSFAISYTASYSAWFAVWDANDNIVIPSSQAQAGTQTVALSNLKNDDGSYGVKIRFAGGWGNVTAKITSLTFYNTITAGLENGDDFAAQDYLSLWSVDNGSLSYADGIKVTMSSGTSVFTLPNDLLSQAVGVGCGTITIQYTASYSAWFSVLDRDDTIVLPASQAATGTHALPLENLQNADGSYGIKIRFSGGWGGVSVTITSLVFS